LTDVDRRLGAVEVRLSGTRVLLGLMARQSPKPPSAEAYLRNALSATNARTKRAVERTLLGFDSGDQSVQVSDLQRADIALYQFDYSWQSIFLANEHFSIGGGGAENVM
jgi:hypothetical protein